MGRGQAALEFLTTYGWAFLVILIMVGALAYFGILKPSKLLPDRCNFGPEVNCLDFQMSRTGNSIKMRIKNNIGEVVTISDIKPTTESITTLTCSSINPVMPVAAWAPGEIRDFTLSTCNLNDVGFVVGEKGKVGIKITYYSVKSGSSYSHDLNGEIFATVV